MRIRTIKPEFFRSESVASLDPLTRILFQGLWCLADRDGRLWDRPRRIKVEVLPYDDCDIEAALRDLERAELIARYHTTTGNAIQIVNFTKHQRITGKESEKASEIPDISAQVPYDEPPKTGEATGKHSGSNGETPGITGKEGKGMEGKGEERNARGEAMGKQNERTDDQKFEPPQIGTETHEEWIGRMKHIFPDRDVDGELRRLKQLCDKDGTSMNRRGAEGWLKKASPSVTPPGKKSPKFDSVKEPDPAGWLDWVRETYGEDCKAYRDRLKYADASKDIQKQFKAFLNSSTNTTMRDGR